MAVVVVLSGCGAGSLSSPMNSHPLGARSPRGAVTAFFHDLERRDGVGMRGVMTPMAQQDESIKGGLLDRAPKLTSFKIGDVQSEDPTNNASPPGAIASLRYTVALTPADGFSDSDTIGSSYDVLVSEMSNKRWLVAELGGSG